MELSNQPLGIQLLQATSFSQILATLTGHLTDPESEAFLEGLPSIFNWFIPSLYGVPVPRSVIPPVLDQGDQGMKY